MSRSAISRQLVILDTSVLVAGFRSRAGASAELIRLALKGAVRVAASVAIFLEYEEVLQREDQRLVHGRSKEEVDLFLGVFSKTIVPVDIYFHWRPQLYDADDEMVLDAAIAGSARAIVTHNVKDFLPAADGFGIRIVTPSQFLPEVRA
jgi:putative PIN family toxin of toxin-antitoxin system